MTALNDYGKLILLLSLLVCATIALALGAISEQLWQGIVTTELGYIVGNGVNAVRKQPPSPVFVPRLERQDPDVEGGA